MCEIQCEADLICNNVNEARLSIQFIYYIVRNRKRLKFLKHDKNTHRLYVSKLFGKGYYVIAISDMYHLITILHTSFLPIKEELKLVYIFLKTIT